MNQYQQQPKNELMIVTEQSEETTEYSLAAQLILEKSLLIFNRQRVMMLIDEALLAGDKDKFQQLSKLYKELN